MGAIIVLIFSSLMGGSNSSDELLCVVFPVGILIGGSGGVVTVVLCKKWGLEINNILASLMGGFLASLFFGGVALKVAIALVFV